MPSLFQSISSFFSSNKDGSHLRRDQAMSSIDDAFSVPPGLFPSVYFQFSSDLPSLLSLDAEYVSSPTVYTYPPPAHNGSYDTVPQSSYGYDLRPPNSASSSSGARSRPTSLLPLYHSPLSPLPNYPPLQQTWSRLRTWLDEQYPELADTLNWGIQPPELAHLELQLGFALPPAVRESYLVVDGQEAESSAGCSEGLFFGLTLLPFEDVVEEWRFWREVDEDPATGANAELRENMRSIPPGWVRREYSQRGWLPLAADKCGNYLGIDMNPDEAGAVGQVIIFGRDFDTKVVMWRGDGEAGWARWLASFVEELESGEGFEVGGGDGSEGSEDDVGYESYFFDGAGRGKGEGGGEGGSGGLRLTGEYRGWTILEALADRSVKRWIEAGVVLPPVHPGGATPSSNAVELGLDASPPRIEVSIHTSVQGDGRTTPTANGDPSVLHTPQPTASVAKAPAPQPVRLPTEVDLLPSPIGSSPTESTRVYRHDEETDVVPMREMIPDTPVQTGSPTSGAKDVTLIPLSSPTTVTPLRSSESVAVGSLSHRQASDPFSNESDALLVETNPDEPSLATPVPEPPDASEVVLPDAVLFDTDSKTPEPSSPLDVPQPSVRLVGAGGISGDATLIDHGPVQSTLEPLASSEPSPTEPNGKRKKEAA